MFPSQLQSVLGPFSRTNGSFQFPHPETVCTGPAGVVTWSPSSGAFPLWSSLVLKAVCTATGVDVAQSD